MKIFKILAFITLIFISLKADSQNKFDSSFETGLSFQKTYSHEGSFISESLLVLKHLNYELTFGIGTTELFEFGSSVYNIRGPIIGVGYHLLNKKRLGHFIFGVNFQTRKYYHILGTIPITITSDTANSFHISPVLYDGKTSNLHFIVGYETVFWKRVSFIARTGLGITKHRVKPTQFGVIKGYNKPVIWELSPYFNLSLRIYLLKQ